VITRAILFAFILTIVNVVGLSNRRTFASATPRGVGQMQPLLCLT
jgi:hypothetical protein